MIKQTIDEDLKRAMLGGDKQLVSVLRTIKGVILDAEIAGGSRESGLPNDQVIVLLQKESKKRGEAATLYDGAGDEARAANERYEQGVLAKYLPEQLGEAEIGQVVDGVLAEMGDVDVREMGKVIGAVKAKTGPSADGGVIAKIVKERLTKN